MLRLALPALALALAACGETPANDSISVLNGAESRTAAPSGPAPAETKGQDFVSTALGGYDFVLASAKLASERAERPEVKDHARKVSADLAASRERLVALATAGKLSMDPIAGPTHQSDLAILSSTRGAPLEIAFAEQQMEALTQLVGLMRAYKNGGDNPQLQAWAAQDQALVNERLLDAQTLKAVLEEAAETAQR